MQSRKKNAEALRGKVLPIIKALESQRAYTHGEMALVLDEMGILPTRGDHWSARTIRAWLRESLDDS